MIGPPIYHANRHIRCDHVEKKKLSIGQTVPKLEQNEETLVYLSNLWDFYGTILGEICKKITRQISSSVLNELMAVNEGVNDIE